MTPAWLALAQGTPYAITPETLQQPARPRGQQYEVPFAPPPNGQAPAPQPVPLGDAIGATLQALGLSEEDLKNAVKTMQSPEGTKIYGERGKENGSSFISKELMPRNDLMEARNRVIGELPAGQFGSGFSDVALPGIKAQRKRLDQVAGALEGISGVARDRYDDFNFLPLLNFYGAEFGKDLTKGYRTPKQEALDLGDLGKGLTQLLLQGTSGLTDDEMDYLKSQFTDKATLSSGTKEKGGMVNTTGDVGGNPLLKALLGFSALQMRGSGGAIPRDPEGMSAKDRAEEKRAEKKLQLEEQKAAELDPKIRDAVAAARDSEAAVSEATTLLGDNAAWVGPADSVIGEVNPWIKPEEDNFRAVVGRLQAAYQRIVTGLGATDSERKSLQKQMPSLSDKTPASFKAKAEGYTKELRRFINNKLDVEQLAGKDVDKYRPGKVKAMIKVRNKTTGEELLIPLDDLPEAEKEGFEKANK